MLRCTFNKVFVIEFIAGPQYFSLQTLELLVEPLLFCRDIDFYMQHQRGVTDGLRRGTQIRELIVQLYLTETSQRHQIILVGRNSFDITLGEQRSEERRVGKEGRSGWWGDD